MPTLLPRESMAATSVVSASIQRPCPFDHRVGFSTTFTRLLIGSLALRPALLLFGNSRPRVTTTPLASCYRGVRTTPRTGLQPARFIAVTANAQVFQHHISPHTALDPAFGRVENRLPPALPRQTMHAVFPHTAFRYSSHLVMRRFSARYCWKFKACEKQNVLVGRTMARRTFA